MRCVLLSEILDLREYLSSVIDQLGEITFVDHRDGCTANDVHMAVAWHPPSDAFDNYPNLKAACSIGAGADSILNCASLRDDIDVVRVVDPAQAQMMSGFVLWNVIWHQRRFARYLAQQRDKIWLRPIQRDAKDVPVGILGYGEIGQRVADDLRMLGFPVSVWSRSKKPTPQGIAGFHGPSGLLAILPESEVLVNLLPLTQETQGILNGDLFEKMRRGGYLIHVGRGEHMVESDVLFALDNGQLSGASLDVFPSEPLGPEHPFWSHPNIIVTPHDACDVSLDAIKATVDATAIAVRTGKRPSQTVDRIRGY